MIVRVERPLKRVLTVHKRRLWVRVTDAEIRLRAGVGNAALLLLYMDAEGDLDDDEYYNYFLFLVVADYDRLYTWVDMPVDVLVRRLLEIETMPPQLLRDVSRFEQTQLEHLHRWLGVPTAFWLDKRCVA
jgi:hypothetical protein